MPHAERAAKGFLPFTEAAAVARALQLASAKEWTVWSKSGARPGNVPSHPDRAYKRDGWAGWPHWLGLGLGAGLGTPSDSVKQARAQPAARDASPRGRRGGAATFLPFTEAMAFARALTLSSKTEWELWRKSGARPSSIPSNPPIFYKHHGWQGWGHWLGTDAPTGGLEVPPPAKKQLRSTSPATGPPKASAANAAMRPGRGSGAGPGAGLHAAAAGSDSDDDGDRNNNDSSNNSGGGNVRVVSRPIVPQ